MTEKRFIPIFDGTDKRVVGAKDNGKIISFMDMFDLLNDLSDENEELKQFKEKVFTWIDKEIARNEESIEWGKETGADSGAMGFYNHMLKRLKKELKE